MHEDYSDSSRFWKRLKYQEYLSSFVYQESLDTLTYRNNNFAYGITVIKTDAKTSLCFTLLHIAFTALLQGLKDCLDANEHIAYHVFVGDTDPYDFGENKSSGIVWDNGELRAFDDQDNLIGKFRYANLIHYNVSFKIKFNKKK